jgi:site-specific DNA recombinase
LVPYYVGMTKQQLTAIYTRISKDRNGESLGVQRQEKACRELADKLGWTVVDVFSDNDISAFNGRRRPEFERLLQAMKDGQIDALVCWHVDRLYRSMKDLERVIDTAEAARLSIKTVNSGELDLSTSAGRMMARILGSVARQESEHAGERRKALYMQSAQAGQWGANGHRTFGYSRDGQPLEPEATMFRQAVVDVLAGKSLRGIARDWQASGVTTTRGTSWSSPRIRRILLNARYAGIKTHNGKEVTRGDWTPLISEDTHRGLVAYLRTADRNPHTSFERKWIGSGVYVCGRCGGPMKAAWDGRRRYQCSQGSCVMRAGQPVDDYVTATVLERLSRKDAHLLLDHPTVNVGELGTSRAALVAKLDELADQFADDVIDGSQLKRGTEKLRARVAKIDAQLAEATRTSPAAALLASGKQLHERWTAMTPGQQAQAIEELVVVKVLPTRRGVRTFDPNCVDIKWRRDT